MSDQNGANNEEQVNNSKPQQRTSVNQKISNLAKAVKKSGAKKTLLLPLVKILVIAFIVILIIMWIIGILMFLITMPGMVMDKLSNLFREAGKYLAVFFGADSTTMIKNENIYETMDYLEQMGWDLKGEGILTKYYESTADIDKDITKDGETLSESDYYIDEAKGVVREANSAEVVLAESDFIFTYIMSDNYVYTIKNDNLVTQTSENLVFKIFQSIGRTICKAYNAVYGPLWDLLGITNASIDAFGKGMLAFYEEDGLGNIGRLKNTGWLFTGDQIKVNVDANTLSIKRSNFLNHNYPIEFNLEGWTGRYGMPLEFLLAIHKATLKPDLAYDMATSFKTNVNIALHDISGRIEAGYKTKNGIVSYDQIKRATDTYQKDEEGNTNIWEDLVNWLDRTITNSEEVEEMYHLGIDIIDDCPDCKTRILYVVYDKNSPDYGEMLVRTENGVIKEDDGTGDFTAGAEFWYSLDDNEYTPWWTFSWLFGGNDADSKGNGEIPIGDVNDNKIRDSYVNAPEPNEFEYQCNYCYCIVSDTSDICGGCGKYARTPVGASGSYQMCDCDTSEEEEMYTETEPWQKYEGDLSAINRYITVIKICDNCTNKAKNILYYLRDKEDYNFKAYQPYIFSVTDHWYRDLYFIDPKKDPNYSKRENPNVNFVEQDYDYESLMKDRWTLYETYEDESDELYGQFIWYIVDKEGKFLTDAGKIEESRVETEGKDPVDTSKVMTGTDNCLYYHVATLEEAQNVGLAVIKKAITFDMSDTDKLSDLGWTQTNGIWTAYKQLTTNVQTGYKPISGLYETYSEYSDTYNGINQNGTSITDKIYINMDTQKNIEQVGEGLRVETNPQIKEMFLQNKYFQYDGSSETAEIITALREKIYEERKNGSKTDKYTGLTNKYGPLTEDEYNSTYTLNINGEEAEYAVKAYAGTVNLEQDALNAFSMLENTHTLDADYIYRDFKELIVELGYYSKEHLTEGEDIPRILLFLIPDIGSSGYPNRTIDKVDQEFGTMVHSKYDIEANKKYTIKEVMNAGNLNYNDEGNNVSAINPVKEKKIASRVNNGRLSLSEKTIEIAEVGQLRPADKLKKPSQIPIDRFFKKTREMCEYMNMVGYDYCVYSEPGDDDGLRGACTCDIHCKEIYAMKGVCYKQLNDPVHHCDCPANHCKHDIHGNPHFLSGTFEGSKQERRNNVCCDYLVTWALQNVGLTAASGNCHDTLNHLVSIGEAKIINKGETIEEGDILRSSGHIEIVGEESGNGFVQYNGGHQIKIGATERGEKSAIGFVTEEDCWKWAEYAFRLNWAKVSEPDIYEGYEGNEAVASPVTGVLLEYGTTTRVNLDQKHKSMFEDEVDGNTGSSTGITTSEVTDNGGLNNPEAITGKIVEEEVGYAKIMVLNKEFYDAYEKKISASHSINTTPISTIQELDSLDYLSETVQAYRDYMELYEYHDIGGYVITIEGFKPQLPDPDFDSNGDEHFDDETSLPQGIDLTFDDFKVSLGNIENPGDKIQTRYEIPKEYVMSSAKATEKLEVEEAMRVDAALAMQVGDYTFIKEGTVLGRTYTDREYILTVRGEQLTDYMSEATINNQEPDEEEGNKDKVIGNYVRIIMDDGTKEEKDKTYVEDVEDYMKLDVVEDAEPNDWELFFWLPFESGPCDDEENGGPECVGVCSPGETAIGIIQWTSLESGTTNNIPAFCRAALDKDSSLCAPLSAFTSWTAEQCADDIGRNKGTYNADSQIKAALNQICAENREAFLAIQMEIAKEQYLEPLLNDYPWLESRRSCVQGIVMHLRVWGADATPIGAMENATDEEIILKCRNIIANTGSTAGAASGDESKGRAYNEPEIALRIVAGELSEDEIEEWVRTKDWSIVGFTPR